MCQSDGIWDKMVKYRHYRNQSYSDLKQKAKTSGQLFTDDLFRPENGSLFFSRNAPPFPVEWKRPKVGNSLVFSCSGKLGPQFNLALYRYS